MLNPSLLGSPIDGKQKSLAHGKIFISLKSTCSQLREPDCFTTLEKNNKNNVLPDHITDEGRIQ
jgi:hypothetical protein